MKKRSSSKKRPQEPRGGHGQRKRSALYCMNRRQRRCLNGTISPPRPLRGQRHEAQRGDIVVSVSRLRLALGAASLQRKDFAAFSSKKCPVHSFVPALLVVFAAGSRIAVSPAASTFVFPISQRPTVTCAADAIEASLRPNPRRQVPAALTSGKEKYLM